MKSKNQKGLSVLVHSEYEFNTLKDFLGEEILYLEWQPQMAKIKTAVVIDFEDEKLFSIGSVGSAEYQKEYGIRVVNFNDYFVITKKEEERQHYEMMVKCGFDCK